MQNEFLPTDDAAIRVAVVGAGIAGASCVHGLLQAGVRVTVFERSANVGGRMATRRAAFESVDGTAHHATFDHGASWFEAERPRFRSVAAHAVAAGALTPWQPIVYASGRPPRDRCFVPVPTAPAFAAHLLSGAELQFDRNVRRLQRAADGTWFVATDGAPLAGPFDGVVLAVPPAQAAPLLAGHHDAWAAELVDIRMQPCWTLMAATDDVDWPWDAAEPDHGPLASVIRNDRMPGRQAPRGTALWTAHATPEWTAEHVDAHPDAVREALKAALAAQLPHAAGGASALRWHHADVQLWRHAGLERERDGIDRDAVRWNPALGVGVCGDWLSGSGVEAAWHGGDELADAMSASYDEPRPAAIDRVVAGADGERSPSSVR